MSLKAHFFIFFPQSTHVNKTQRVGTFAKKRSFRLQFRSLTTAARGQIRNKPVIHT